MVQTTRSYRPLLALIASGIALGGCSQAYNHSGHYAGAQYQDAYSSAGGVYASGAQGLGYDQSAFVQTAHSDGFSNAGAASANSSIYGGGHQQEGRYASSGSMSYGFNQGVGSGYSSASMGYGPYGGQSSGPYAYEYSGTYGYAGASTQTGQSRYGTEGVYDGTDPCCIPTYQIPVYIPYAVEKTVEKRVEVPVEKIVEKIVEKPVYIEKPVTYPTPVTPPKVHRPKKK